MSHSTVLVIGPRTIEELELALAPFDENLKVEPYIKATREQQIQARRDSHQQAAEDREEYLNRKPPYDRADYDNRGHIQWIMEEAPAEALLDDDALWEVIQEKRSWDKRDEDGNVWSTYSPSSRWDWYQVGGRWDGCLVSKMPTPTHHRMEPHAYPVSTYSPENLEPHDGLHSNFIEKLEDLDLEQTHETFAVLTPDGQWHQRGHVHWFGMVRNEAPEDEWKATWLELIYKHADQPAFLVDVHI